MCSIIGYIGSNDAAPILVRALEKMEYRGLLERKSVGRATEVFPTEKSLALKPELKKAWQSLYKQYNTILGKDEARQLTDDIYSAYAAIDN